MTLHPWLSHNIPLIKGNSLSNSYATNDCAAHYSSGFPNCAGGSQYTQAYSSGPGFNLSNENYIAKFNKDAQLLWSTFIGGYGPEGDHPALTYDSRDLLYVVGQTFSPMALNEAPFPTNPSNFVYYQGQNQDEFVNQTYGFTVTIRPTPCFHS